VISSAKQPLQSVMLGVVTQKLQEVFGKHFFERVLQVCVCVRVCEWVFGPLHLPGKQTKKGPVLWSLHYCI